MALWAFPFPLREDGAVPVDWKDVRFSSYDLHLRLYKPRSLPLAPATKFPVFYYFHGGGYCLGARDWPGFHNCCLRLAPEHRLPAALDDATTALLWLRTQAGAADPWLAELADLGRVFVSGESARGNIAHHLAVRLSSPEGRAERGPVLVRGFVLLLPFFGGAQQTRSEAECPQDAMLSQELSDRYWRLALPAGTKADHPASNPFGLGAPSLETAELGPMLVVAAERELLRDRTLEYARRLKEWGKPVEVVEVEGQQHGFFGLNPWSEPAGVLIEVIRQFMAKVEGGDQ